MSNRLQGWGFALLLMLLAGSACAQTGPSYHVAIITDGTQFPLQGQMGYFQLQFSKGDLMDSLDATAQVSNFQLGGGTLTPPADAPGDAVTGAVTGDLTKILTFANTDSGSVNSLVQGVTFGSGLSFDVSFAGDAFDPTLSTNNGSLFALSLYDASGDPLPPTSTSGDVLDVNIAPNAVVTTQTFASDVTATPFTPGVPPTPGGSAVPESSSLLLLGAGGLLLALRRRRCAA